MKVCFETFGCRLNRAEALEEEAKYLARGWEPTESHADAQLIVIRGCSVTSRAQRDCEHLIEHIKRKYPFKRVIVTGCLSSANKAYHLKERALAIGQADVVTDPVPTRTARAYLKVQDGCNGACAFCIVPRFRGRSVSVPFDDVLDKAGRFIDAGYREIVITGCNLAAYASGERRLPELLDALAVRCAAAPMRVRLRLGSLEPGPVALETVKVMAAHDNICRFLHVPVQSGSPRLLIAMRRPYQIRQVDELLLEAAKRMPDLGLGYDIMTGFPGETEIDQLATLGFLKRHPFNKAHVFPYSERPGTIAPALPGAVPRDLRRLRAHDIAALADDARTRFAKRFRGKTVEIVVEDEEHVGGWTSEYLWCSVGESCPGVTRKSLVRIAVRETKGHQLIGDLV